MRCRSALTRVDALRTRELSHEERSAVEDHLKTCRSCDQSLHDVDRFTLTSDTPLPFQVDGDDLGERTKVTFEAIPRALTVLV